jgi:hypothetical protein
MIKTIIIDLAGLFVIGSSVYDMYVKHKLKKGNEELRRVNDKLEKEVDKMSSTKKIDIDSEELGKIAIKAINKAQVQKKSKLIM